ncbi:GroES-like protein [Ophiobolus disseminans]|uniref:GroES-like protein n=1 Tax=Ophiobolus disseminans TaxID=1469910 RepID=A0A6A6ZER3_9PLEO|nr:GroES-like protein [Ophiobolus disseminans]
METMKAWTHTSAGLPSNVLKQSSVPKPTITSKTQVLIKISHCALNPAGSIVMQLFPFIFRASPAVPEMDFSGTIVEAGSDVPGVRDLKLGTKVFGSIPLGQHVKSTCGALADYVAVDHTAIALKADHAIMSEVAGLGIAGATALELIKAANLTKGGSVLVNGAGGGIGHLVVQMCLEKIGASGKVVAICSKRSSDWIRSLAPMRDHEGDHTNIPSTHGSRLQIIDREEEPLIPSLVKSFSDTRFDAIIDAVGIQDIFMNSPAFLAEGKPYVTVGPKAYNYTYLSMLATIGTMAKNMCWPRTFGGTPRPYVQVAAASNLEALEELAGMVKIEKLKARAGIVVGWDDVPSAYTHLLSGHAGGKIIVEVDGTCNES